MLFTHCVNMNIKQVKRRIAIRRCRRKFKQKCFDYKRGKCQNCNYAENLAALQFHHLDPNGKDFSISSATTTKWEVIVQELDKCILLCANCNLSLHEEEKDKEHQQLMKKSNYINQLFGKNH